MIYIRTDMNDIIATGHVMRTLAVADAARMRGEETTFILADAQAAALLEERKYPYLILHTAWNDMESELPALKRVIRERKIKRILVDSYQVTPRYFEELNKIVEAVYIDDLNAFHYEVDTLICYANYWEKFRYEEKYPGTRLLLGTEYVPLRQVFFDRGRKSIAPQIKRVLLMSGGTDRYGVLERFLNETDTKSYEQIDVICGRYNGAYDTLCREYAQEQNIRIHRAVPDIECYMIEADLAISAGGITLYELCACGTPTISYALADNQLDNVKKFQEDGQIAYAGDVRTDDVVKNIKRCMEIYDAASVRQEKSLQMQELVDGKGARRIADVLILG